MNQKNPKLNIKTELDKSQTQPAAITITIQSKKSAALSKSEI